MHPPLFLLFAWLAINVLQAGLTPLDPDETYYWMYANRLDWGYFDHPPAVAVLIAAGKDWLPGALGLRLGHVLASAVTLVGIWHLLGKPTGKWLGLAAALVFAQPFVHVYGFIATPDGPLLLFTVGYLLAYRRFLCAPTPANGALWGLTMAGLLYGKYHGVLLIFFTVLPQLFWLLRRPGAWVAALGGAALYAPHLYWQYANDFPSFRYHLSGRDDAYRLQYTLEFLLNQLLVFSPLLVWSYGKTLYRLRGRFTLRKIATPGVGAGPRVRGEVGEAKWADAAFVRANLWLIAGFVLFFLYTTTKGKTEAQWTALLSVPLCYLTYRTVRDEATDWMPAVKKLGLATILILVIARLSLIAPRDWLPFGKPFDHQPWTERLARRAGDRPVMVHNSYRFASLYEFYTGKPAWTFTDVEYRRNQYDLWVDDAAYHNRPALLLAQASWNRPAVDTFRTQKRTMLVQEIDSFQVAKALRLTPQDELPDTLRPGVDYPLTLIGQSPHPINLVTADLPLRPFLTVYFGNEQLHYNKLRRGVSPRQFPALRPTVLFHGTFRLGKDVTPGPADIGFGVGYDGLPPLRGQSKRYAVIIVD